jgi:FAD synthase
VIDRPGHILDFVGDLNGQKLGVEFWHWLRGMETFESLDELVRTTRLVARAHRMAA